MDTKGKPSNRITITNGGKTVMFLDICVLDEEGLGESLDACTEFVAEHVTARYSAERKAVKYLDDKEIN